MVILSGQSIFLQMNKVRAVAQHMLYKFPSDI